VSARALHRLAHGGKTHISFAGPPSFGIAHLPAILREFMLTCAERADLQFAFGELSGYSVHSLPGDEMVFTTAPSLGLPSPQTPPEALLDLPLFTRREGCCCRVMLERNLVTIGHTIADFHKIVVIDDLHLVVQAVVGGEGVSFLSRDVLDEHLRGGRLVVHHVPGFQHHLQRALVINRPEPLAPPLVEFVATVFAHFALPLPASIPRPVSPVRRRTA
jgi:DNA-binding transcriptional LysR family regulator